jgi:hypothetical protein
MALKVPRPVARIFRHRKNPESVKFAVIDVKVIAGSGILKSGD